MTQPTTLGGLKQSVWASRRGRSVRDELRDNLICRLESGLPVFEGIVGYDDTVVPQIVNASLQARVRLPGFTRASDRRQIGRAHV